METNIYVFKSNLNLNIGLSIHCSIICTCRFCLQSHSTSTWATGGTQFILCMVCYLQAEPRSGEWIQCFNSPVPLTCNALRLMGAQLRLCLTAYAPQCVHIWAQDQGSPHKWQTLQRANICHGFFSFLGVYEIMNYLQILALLELYFILL